MYWGEKKQGRSRTHESTGGGGGGGWGEEPPETIREARTGGGRARYKGTAHRRRENALPRCTSLRVTGWKEEGQILKPSNDAVHRSIYE